MMMPKQFVRFLLGVLACTALTAYLVSRLPIAPLLKGVIWYLLPYLAFLRISYVLGKLYGVELRPSFAEKVYDATRNVSRFTRLREQVGGAVYVLSRTAVWPVLVVRLPRIAARFVRGGRARLPTRLLMQADQRLHPRILLDSLAVAIMTVVGYALTLAGWIPFFYLPFLLAATFSTLTLLAFTIGPASFPEQLRRAPGNPHLNLLRLAATIGTTVLVSSLALRYTTHVPEPRQILALLLELTPGNALRTLFSLPRLSLLQVQMSITGLLLVSSLLTGIWKVKDYRREDRDFEQIAESLVRFAVPSEAVQWLAKIRNPSQNSCVVSVVAYLGVNQLDRALQAAKMALALKPEHPLTAEPFAFAAFSVIHYPIPKHVIREMMSRWVREGGGDAQMLLVLSALVALDRYPQGEVGTLFVDANVRKRFPLAYAGALLTLERADTARRVLQRTAAHTPLDAAIKEFLQLMATLSGSPTGRENPVIFINRWLTRNAARFDALAGELPQELDRLISFGLSSIVTSLCKEIAPERVEEWRFIATRQRESLQTEETRKIAQALAINWSTLETAIT